jgi:putative tricarboxylic transport membrane protein
MYETLTIGLPALASPEIWLSVIAGILLGVAVGAIPGLGPSIATSLALPFTFTMTPVASLCFIMAIYTGSCYGGSISAILMNIPGTSGATATTFDGYPMAEKGQAGKALRGALYASVFGSTCSTFTLVCFSASLARVALGFGPAQMFAILLFSFFITGLMETGDKTNALLSSALGVLLGIAGKDPIVGSARLDIFGLARYEQIEEVAFLIGAFAFSECLFIIRRVTSERRKGEERIIIRDPSGSTLSVKEFFSYWKTLIRSGVIGSILGIVPGIGATISSLTCYGLAKSTSKHPEKFGTGIVEGVIAPECGNNATAGSNLLPYLSLGVPGSPLVALWGAALLMQGIVPSPRIFADHGDVIYKIFAGLLLGNIVLCVVGISAFNKIAAKVALVDKKIMVCVIVVLCFAGAFCLNNRIYDVYILIFAGVLAYFVRMMGLATAPMVVAFVLERLMETSFRQSILISRGSVRIFFADPLSVGIWAAMILFFIYIAWSAKRRGDKEELKEDD